jgi:hypothetical protein
MKRILLLLTVAAMFVTLFLPSGLLADDDEYAKDAQYAEGNPPMVPHKMEPNSTGDACLVCHLEGKNGAPLTSHAVRVDCVQCHAQGEIKERKAVKKSSDKKKKKHKEKE